MVVTTILYTHKSQQLSLKILTTLVYQMAKYGNPQPQRMIAFYHRTIVAMQKESSLTVPL
jgi:hypothetical protein